MDISKEGGGATRRKDPSSKVERGTSGDDARLLDDDDSSHNKSNAASSPTRSSTNYGGGGYGGSGDNGSIVGVNTMAGLTVVGMAASLLAGTFGLFHVDTFLTAYHLSPTVFSGGNLIYGFINAANDVAGAWLVDHVATSRRRSDFVGLTGCLFALCFLAPFFRPWKGASHWFWDGAHFVLSLSLYDTLYSFAMILYGSIVSDDHEMSEKTRVRFLTICKVVNLVASFAVARLGLSLFDPLNLAPFQAFLLVLAAVACGLSIVAQGLIVGDKSYSIKNIFPKKVDKGDEATLLQKRNLEWRRVVRDFWNHKNFCAWAGTNMLLESGNNFNHFFTKTFFDRLVVNNGVDKETCDWIISSMRPMTAMLSLAAFIPIRKYGYVKVYRVMFIFNGLFALLMLLAADSTSTNWIIAFLIIFPAISAAVHSAVFSLAMADMVMEMKHKHGSAGRFDEASLAGLFMGANALVCKPMDAVLPSIAAQALADESNAQRNLFYVLILPPLVYSCLQFLSWKNYTLEPERSAKLRTELKAMLSRTDSDDASGGGRV